MKDDLSAKLDEQKKKCEEALEKAKGFAVEKNDLLQRLQKVGLSFLSLLDHPNVCLDFGTTNAFVSRPRLRYNK